MNPGEHRGRRGTRIARREEREYWVYPNGEQRRFLEDGDEIILRGRARRDGAVTIGFGECRAVVLPAIMGGDR